VDTRQFQHRLAAVSSVNILVDPVPYHGGKFSGWHCHKITSGYSETADALRPLVSAPQLTDYERAWVLWLGALSTLNRAALIPRAEPVLFKAGARVFVRILQGSFPWMSISPKRHMLSSHYGEFMGLWGSTGLYSEQAIESWHSFHNHNAPRFTAETALLPCRKLVQTTALSGVASDGLRREKTPISKRKAGTRGALRPGDQRLRKNKTWRRKCLATLQKNIEDRAKCGKRPV